MNLHLVLLSGGAGHKPPPLIDIDATALVQLGLFLFLLVVLSKLVFKPYLALKAERDERTEGAREAAKSEEADATKKLDDYEVRLLSAQREAAFGRAERREEGEKAAAKRLAEARAKTEAKLQEARARLEKSIPEAEAELKKHAEQLSLDIASHVLGRQQS